MHVDLSITSPEPESEGAPYHCVATGYPDVRLLTWQSGTGHHIAQPHYNTSSEVHKFNTTLVSTLTVDGGGDTCIQSRGYLCVFSNGGSPANTKSLDVNCIPGRIYNFVTHSILAVDGNSYIAFQTLLENQMWFLKGLNMELYIMITRSI